MWGFQQRSLLENAISNLNIYWPITIFISLSAGARTWVSHAGVESVWGSPLQDCPTDYGAWCIGDRLRSFELIRCFLHWLVSHMSQGISLQLQHSEHLLQSLGKRHVTWKVISIGCSYISMSFCATNYHEHNCIKQGMKHVQLMVNCYGCTNNVDAITNCNNHCTINQDAKNAQKERQKMCCLGGLVSCQLKWRMSLWMVQNVRWYRTIWILKIFANLGWRMLSIIAEKSYWFQMYFWNM